MRIRLSLAVLLLSGAAVLSPSLGSAQPAPPSAIGAVPTPPVGPQATDASRREAQSMADLLSIPLQTRNIVQAMRNQLIQATIQASGKPVDEAAKIVDEVLMPDFNAAVPQLSEALLEPWAVNFTAADLKTLHDFFNTPVGQKWLRSVPTVNQQAAQASQAWFQRNFQEAVRKHSDDLHARGLKF